MLRIAIPHRSATWVGGRPPIKLCDGMHFRSSEFRGDGAHLLIDVIAPQALREGSELAFDVRRLLAREARRT